MRKAKKGVIALSSTTKRSNQVMVAATVILPLYEKNVTGRGISLLIILLLVVTMSPSLRGLNDEKRLLKNTFIIMSW